jgi:hypothetical protein
MGQVLQPSSSGFESTYPRLVLEGNQESIDDLNVVALPNSAGSNLESPRLPKQENEQADDLPDSWDHFPPLPNISPPLGLSVVNTFNRLDHPHI